MKIANDQHAIARGAAVHQRPSSAMPHIGVPELDWIALVRLDVISDLCRRDQAYCLATRAKRMLPPEASRHIVPCCAVASHSRRSAARIVFSIERRAIALLTRAELGRTGWQTIRPCLLFG